MIYDNEVLALAGLVTIQAARLRVPEDIGVVVWEDNPIWTAICPHLTALHRDATNLGSDGAALLISAIEGADVIEAALALTTAAE
jgi:DNA-binding LacI/PurR family transcriptional regulator